MQTNKETALSRNIESKEMTINSTYKKEKLPKVFINPHFSALKINTDVQNNDVRSSGHVFLNPRVLLNKQTSVHINPKVLREKSMQIHVNPNLLKVKAEERNIVHVNPLFVNKIIENSSEENIVLRFESQPSENLLNVSEVSNAAQVNTLIDNQYDCSSRDNSINVHESSHMKKECNKLSLDKSTLSSQRCSLMHSRKYCLNKYKLLRSRPKLKVYSPPAPSRLISSKYKVIRNTKLKSKYRYVKEPLRSVVKRKGVRSPLTPVSKYVLDKRLKKLPLDSICRSRRRLVTNNRLISKYAIDKRIKSTCSANFVPKFKIIWKQPQILKYVSDKQIKRTRKYSVRKKYKIIHAQKNFNKGNVYHNKVWIQRTSINKRIYTISSKKLARIGNYNHNGKFDRGVTTLVQLGGVFYKASQNKLMKARPESKQKVNTGLQVKKSKLVPGKTIYIRGNKYTIDPSGRTLQRIDDERNVKQHPIGRVDIGGITFIKKSNNVLIRTNTHKARNVVSRAKQRSIAMLRNKMKKDNQPCMFFHKFGKCFGKDKGTCPRVHDPKNIMICPKFLNGQCNTKDCLLSHDLVPEKMPTCKYFLEVACLKDNCPYLHVKVNAKAGICMKFLQGFCEDGSKCKKRHEFSCPDFEKGKCTKGKSCLYPHKTNILKGKLNVNVKPLEKSECIENKTGGEKRYYTQVMDSEEKIDEACSSQTTSVRRRKMLGKLPSFIPFS